MAMEFNLLCPLGEESMDCGGQMAGILVLTYFAAVCLCLLCVIVQACRPMPDEGIRVIVDADNKPVKVPYKITRPDELEEGSAPGAPRAKTTIVWDIDVLKETKIVKDILLRSKATTDGGASSALEDIKVEALATDGKTDIFQAPARQDLEDLTVLNKGLPFVCPMFPKDAVVEYFSITVKTWLVGRATPRVVRRKTLRIQYDVKLKDGITRTNVDLARLRYQFRPSEDVDIFVKNSGGGKWMPGKTDENQSAGPTTMGYRVNWSHGLLLRTPPERLRRRFIPDEKVYVYRGLQEGWVVGYVRGHEDSIPREQQRIRTEELFGDFAASLSSYLPTERLLQIPLTNPDGGDGPTNPATPRLSGDAMNDVNASHHSITFDWVRVEVILTAPAAAPADVDVEAPTSGAAEAPGGGGNDEAEGAAGQAAAQGAALTTEQHIDWYPTFLLRRDIDWNPPLLVHGHDERRDLKIPVSLSM